MRDEIEGGNRYEKISIGTLGAALGGVFAAGATNNDTENVVGLSQKKNKETLLSLHRKKLPHFRTSIETLQPILDGEIIVVDSNSA